MNLQPSRSYHVHFSLAFAIFCEQGAGTHQDGKLTCLDLQGCMVQLLSFYLVNQFPAIDVAARLFGIYEHVRMILLTPTAADPQTPA